jgi:hypothetical protein
MSATATEPQAAVEVPPAPTTADPVPALPVAQPENAGKKSKSKESKGKKSKDSSSKPAPEASGSPSVAAHPRAARAVAQAKGWGGLAGFFLAGYLSLPTGTLAEAALRALVAGSVCYVAAWGGAVFVWRRLVIIEMKGREQRLAAGAQVAPTSLEGPASAERSRARMAS